MHASSSAPSLALPKKKKKLSALPARREELATGQGSILAAADDMIAGIERRMADQQRAEEKETPASAAAAAASAKRAGASRLASTAVPPSIRRRGDAALRSLLTTLDARVPVPLTSLPAHVNTGVLLNEQAYAGTIRRLRNVVEQFPSTFKTLHAHVNTQFKKEEPDAPLAANMYSFGTAAVIRERDAASPERRTNDAERSTTGAPSPAQARPNSRGPASPQTAHQVRFAATHVVEDQIPGSLPYNRYGSQRPAVVDAYRQFHKAVDDLPPMRNPHPNRDWKTSAVHSAELNPALMGRVKPASPPPGPIVLSRDRPVVNHLPSHIDFRYTPHERELTSALANLPVPLGTIHPKMFEYSYTPAIIHKKSHEVIGPDGKITTAAQGYSASERVALLVDDFRNEYTQASANQAWLAEFRVKHEAEKKAAKSKHAKEVWRQAMLESGYTIGEDGRARRPSSTASSSKHRHHRPSKAARTDGTHLAVPGTSSQQASQAASRDASPTGSRRPSRSVPRTPSPGAASQQQHAMETPDEKSRRPSKLLSPNTPQGSPSRSPSGSPKEGVSRRGSVRPPAIDTSSTMPKSVEAGQPGSDDDTPSPTTPEGFYFAAKLTSASYNRKRMERDLGLAPEPHEYDSEVDEWIHGSNSDSNSNSSGGEDSEEREERELAAHDARSHDEKMDRMLRDVMEKHKDLHAKSTQYTAILPKRSKKTLNAARFVMTSPTRKKSRLAPGETYAKGDGRVSAALEWEAEERKRKEKEEHALEQIRTQHHLTQMKHATQDAAHFFVGTHHSTSKQPAVDPDAPHQYVTIEPAWLRSRADYREDFLPRSFEQMCLNSMQKPIAIRTKMEVDNIGQWLKTLPYIKDFASNPALQAELVALCRLHPVKKEEVLWKRGDPVTHLYLLISGELRSIQTPSVFAEASPLLRSPRNEEHEMPQELLRMMRRASMRTEEKRRSINDRLMLAAAVDGKLMVHSPVPFRLDDAAAGGDGAPDAPASHDETSPSVPDRRATFASSTHGNVDGASRRTTMSNAGDAPPVEFGNLASPLRQRRAVALVADHGASVPGAILTALKPRIMFGQSKEQQIQREADEKLARQVLGFLTPVQRRWQLLRERALPKKHLQSSFQSAEALDQLGGGVAQHQYTSLRQLVRRSSPDKKERFSKEALAARIRPDTVVGVAEENILISINQADHDRILRLSVARHHRAQTLLLKSMRMFQHDQHKHGHHQEWKIKNLIQLVGHVERLVFERGALMGEEDDLQHMVYFVVSGHVAVYKDIELITQSRLPTHTNEWTIIENTRFRRIHVGARGKGDCIGEECIAGCAKLDFTYKAASARVEVLALRRTHFLPFFRATRLADIKSRVSTARSQAVNFINSIVPDFIPGNAREQVGIMETAPHATDQLVEERKHRIHVNMLETHLSDLLGEEYDTSSSIHSPKPRRRRHVLTPPHSPLLRSMAQTTLPGTSTGLIPPPTVVPASHTVEKRPHSPAKYNVGVKLPVTLHPAVTPNKRLAPTDNAAVTLTPEMVGSTLHVQAHHVEQLQAHLPTPKVRHGRAAGSPPSSSGGQVNSASVGLKASSGGASRVVGRGREEAAPPCVNIFFSTFAM